MQNACRLHATCQNEVALNCIWLILPSVSEPFAHFWMFFHLLHFTTPHFLCHKRLILLSSTKTIVPPNRQVQKPSLSCKKPACWFIKILSNRDSKMMQDFFWKGGSTFYKYHQMLWISELRLLGLLEISQLQASWAVHAKRVQGGCGTAWAAQNGQN